MKPFEKKIYSTTAEYHFKDEKKKIKDRQKQEDNEKIFGNNTENNDEKDKINEKMDCEKDIIENSSKIKKIIEKEQFNGKINFAIK